MSNKLRVKPLVFSVSDQDIEDYRSLALRRVLLIAIAIAGFWWLAFLGGFGWQAMLILAGLFGGLAMLAYKAGSNRLYCQLRELLGFPA